MEKEMIYLDRNENNYGPAPACFEVLKKADLTKLSWYTKAYSRGVKSILSERLAKEFDIPESRVVLGYGAEDLLKQAVQCYLGKGEKLMIPTHSWWYYKKIADEVDGINVEYPLVPNGETFEYDIDALFEKYEKEKPKMVFISSPNNPTGNSISQENLIKVLEKLQDAIIILDEAYFYNVMNETVRNLVNSYPNLLVIRTFSKYYALAGMRIGFGLLGENLAQLNKYTNRYLGYHRISEEVALAALDSPDYYLDIADKMDSDRKMFFTELNKIPGFTAYKSNANFILVEIPDEIQADLKEFLKSKGLVVKFMNEELLNHHLRITLGTQEENKLLIDAIKEFAANNLS
jgi:histidinol-phosphate aminotransferase